MEQQTTTNRRISQSEKEDEFRNLSEKSWIVTWFKRASIFAVPMGLVQAILSGNALKLDSLNLSWYLLLSGVAYIFVALYGAYWSNKAERAFNPTTSLYLMNLNERKTKTVMISCTIAILVSIIFIINMYFQQNYDEDFIISYMNQPSDVWAERFGDETPGELMYFFNNVLRNILIIQGFFLIYFIAGALISSKYVKAEDEAMGDFVSATSLFLFATGLAILMQADFLDGYNAYPTLATLFPDWSLDGLFYLGGAAAGIGFLGVLIGYGRWRFLVFILILLALAYTSAQGFYTNIAYDQSLDIYEFYSGNSTSVSVCLNRMEIIHERELLEFECPQKYLPETACDASQRVERWEEGSTGDQRCLNENCCGLLGEIYAADYLALTNLGIFATLIGFVVFIGSISLYKHLIPGKTSRRNWLWIPLLFLVAGGFAGYYYGLNENHYIEEFTNPDGSHLEWATWGSPAPSSKGEKYEFGPWGTTPAGPVDFEIDGVVQMARLVHHHEGGKYDDWYEWATVRVSPHNTTSGKYDDWYEWTNWGTIAPRPWNELPVEKEVKQYQMSSFTDVPPGPWHY